MRDHDPVIAGRMIEDLVIGCDSESDVSDGEGIVPVRFQQLCHSGAMLASTRNLTRGG